MHTIAFDGRRLEDRLADVPKPSDYNIDPVVLTYEDEDPLIILKHAPPHNPGRYLGSEKIIFKDPKQLTDLHTEFPSLLEQYGVDEQTVEAASNVLAERLLNVAEAAVGNDRAVAVDFHVFENMLSVGVAYNGNGFDVLSCLRRCEPLRRGGYGLLISAGHASWLSFLDQGRSATMSFYRQEPAPSPSDAGSDPLSRSG